MEKVIIAYKEIGETPLDCLERVRKDKDIKRDIPMTYAGRLDPMACGLLPILIGEECKNKQKYLNYNKEYEVEILFGIRTDSYDILGIIESINQNPNVEIDWNNYIGKFKQKYPKYSSKIIDMKEIPEQIPEKEVEIYSIEELNRRREAGKIIAKEIINKIKKVKGDFRQKEIIESWNRFSLKYENIDFCIIKIKVKCGSGTYMRVLANNLNSLAYSIKRTALM